MELNCHLDGGAVYMIMSMGQGKGLTSGKQRKANMLKAEKILEFVFPSNIYCICCGSYIDKNAPYALCENCLDGMHWATGRVCAKCGKPLGATYDAELCYDCRVRRHSFDRGFTCTSYGLYERSIMMDYKYNGKAYIGKKIGEIMADRLSHEDRGWQLLIPIPIHSRRRAKRGFNQAEIMADAVSQILKIESDSGIIIRSRDTKPMRSLGNIDREVNVAGAFEISPRRRQGIHGRRILLIDDIFTTGATFDAAADVLLEAGAAVVDVASFAGGFNRRPAGRDDELTE